MIYFTADTHFTHLNISGTEGRWDSGHRGFASLQEHDDFMLDMLNQAGPEDTIYLLGDFVFNRKMRDQVAGYLEQVKCNDIHFILGNHDPYFQHIYDTLGWESLKEYPFTKLTDVTPLKEINVHGQRITLCHYGLEVWNKSHKGTWHIHGHSHDTLPPRGKRTDVCPETALRLLGEMRMFTFDDLKEILNARPVDFVDHHSKDTAQ